VRAGSDCFIPVALSRRKNTNRRSAMQQAGKYKHCLIHGTYYPTKGESILDETTLLAQLNSGPVTVTSSTFEGEGDIINGMTCKSKVTCSTILDISFNMDISISNKS